MQRKLRLTDLASDVRDLRKVGVNEHGNQLLRRLHFADALKREVHALPLDIDFAFLMRMQQRLPDIVRRDHFLLAVAIQQLMALLDQLVAVQKQVPGLARLFQSEINRPGIAQRVPQAHLGLPRNGVNG